MSSQAPLAVLRSAVVNGVRSTLVTVEVHRGDGVPQQTIVGLPGKAVRESLDRIHGACQRIGVALGPRRTTINLAPADHPKAGTGLDLPIALGMLAADGVIPVDRLGDAVCVGELQLDGSVRGVPGVLPAALAARDAGVERIVVPAVNAAEAVAVEEVVTVPIASLRQALAWARGGILPAAPQYRPRALLGPAADLCEIAGQPVGRRALEIAAAGGHHLLLTGLPGAGKTLLARALPGILPELTRAEALEASAVYSAAGKLGPGGLLRESPFRAPHHSVTAAGLIGGGVPLKPGEVSLAHCGVLFLDELPEFRREALEALRQPLEEGSIRLVRGGRTAQMPARFQLVAAMNPCPCGQGPDSDTCRCTLGQVRGYWRRLSGPLLDRLDIVLEVDPVAIDQLIGAEPGAEPSVVVRERVAAARKLQRRRRVALEKCAPGKSPCAVSTNAALEARQIPIACPLDQALSRRARREAARLGISARGWHRVLRVARTIADLAGREELDYADLAEAFQYRHNTIDASVTALCPR